MRSSFALLAAACGAALVACGSSSTATGSPSPATSGTPNAAAAPPAVAVATTLDPCQLVTSQEAASLAGVSYGPGRPATYGGAGGSSNGCTYGYQTLDVFMVLVSQAPDAGSANAMWAQEQAQSQAALATAAGTAGTSLNVNVNDVANITGATRVAVGTGTITRAGTTINISVIYMLKNAIFFTFSNLAVGHATPSLSAMEAQGTTVIGRLP